MKRITLALAALFSSVLFITPAIAIEGNTSMVQSRPLSFIENKGQITDQHYNIRHDIDFKLSASGIDIFIGEGQVHYQWTKFEKLPAMDKERLLKDGPGTVPVTIYRMDVQLIGANKNAVAIAEDKQDYYENYYLASVPNGATAHTFNKVIYKDIYPNIDWVLYTRDNQLKYEFIVRKGGKVSDIKLRYHGADRLQLNDGALTATTSFGSITEAKPYSYEAETEKEITSAYVLDGNTLSFNTAPHSGTLIIDPDILWTVYHGGTQWDKGYDLKADKTGDLVLAGITFSSNNIATTGTHQQSMVGFGDAFIAKYSPAGQLIWGTYYGGNKTEDGINIGTDPNTGDIFISGFTASNIGIATPGTYNSVYTPGWAMGFVAKFSTAGQRIWGTYIAHMNYGQGLPMGSFSIYWTIYHHGKITVDDFGYVYYACHVPDTSLGTPGTHQPQYKDSLDICLARFTPNGQLDWCTYFGGYGKENINGLSHEGNYIYLTGTTSSLTGIATPGSHQPQHAGGYGDAFIAKFNTGGTVEWSTYYGGNGFDVGYRNTIDAEGNMIMEGFTNSVSGIATPGTYSQGLQQTSNTYLVKFHPSGNRIWGTYMSGLGAGNNSLLFFPLFSVDNAQAITANHNSDILVTNNGPVTPFGNAQSFSCIAKFNKSGMMVWRTGTNQQQIGALVTAFPNKLYAAGGLNDAFLILLQTDSMDFCSASDTFVCLNAPFNVHYNSETTTFNQGNVFTVQMSDVNGSFANPDTIGTLNSASPSGIISCLHNNYPKNTNGYRIRVMSSSPIDSTAPGADNIWVFSSVSANIPIIQTPPGPVYPGQVVTFTYDTSAIAWNSQYSWMVNGVVVSSGTPVYQHIITANDDSVTLYLSTTSPCGGFTGWINHPIVFVNSVSDKNTPTPFTLSPNPNKGSFIIKGDINTDLIQVEVVNTVGQVVYNETEKVTSNTLNKTITLDESLPAGVYLLRLQSSDGNYTMRLVLQR